MKHNKNFTSAAYFYDISEFKVMTKCHYLFRLIEPVPGLMPCFKPQAKKSPGGSGAVWIESTDAVAPRWLQVDPPDVGLLAAL
ncbi:hypothetical protein [Pseudomonas saponiphila]|uniref:hypothetical protein n=1 Tax=Pseudomonas saponiphila TaxID=556534 RepID=UPI00115FEA32|nr:hypothetical protein [Pseudomonas saponiphila]